MYTCRTCHVAEPASSPCVYQNNLNSQVGDTAGVTQDVGSDPTVGAPEFCTYCGEEISCSVCETRSDGAYESSDFYEEEGDSDGFEEEKEEGN
jgi:DNA-directed RNA polymerase II subunit RPB9